jgi:probable rRNA maturation factor
MKPEIHLLNENKYDYPDDIDDVIETTLTVLNQDKKISVNINLVDEQEISELNKQFRDYSEPTDVLSFEAGVIDPETGNKILGDIVICIPFVEKQSTLLQNNLNNEIRLMIIHGMLHLLGYNHDDEHSKSIMWGDQNKILEKLQIELNNIPE